MDALGKKKRPFLEIIKGDENSLPREVLTNLSKTRVKEHLTMDELADNIEQIAALDDARLERILVVYNMLLKGFTFREIKKKMMDEYEIPSRTFDRYIREARLMMKEDSERFAKDAYEWHIASRRQILKEFHYKEDLIGALNTLKDLAKLQGLYAQDKAALAKAGLDDTANKKLREATLKIESVLKQIAGSDEDYQEDIDDLSTEEDQGE